MFHDPHRSFLRPGCPCFTIVYLGPKALLPTTWDLWSSKACIRRRNLVLRILKTSWCLPLFVGNNSNDLWCSAWLVSNKYAKKRSHSEFYTNVAVNESGIWDNELFCLSSFVNWGRKGSRICDLLTDKSRYEHTCREWRGLICKARGKIHGRTVSMKNLADVLPPNHQFERGTQWFRTKAYRCSNWIERFIHCCILQKSPPCLFP